MATVAFFKFQDTEETSYVVDQVPTELSGDIVSADLKTFLAGFYDDHEADCRPGALIFSNSGDGINAPVLMVGARIPSYDQAEGGVDDHILFHVSDQSASFRIPPTP